jgi:hypothetical protein
MFNIHLDIKFQDHQLHGTSITFTSQICASAMLWGGLQWHNNDATFHENRSTHPRFEMGNTHIHTYKDSMIISYAYILPLRNENRRKNMIAIHDRIRTDSTSLTFNKCCHTYSTYILTLCMKFNVFQGYF